uniref:SMP-30/Gluconolactonase/LRE-like region domain-containing protein n=2 Tax=Tetranychus urticae TaxID=32264 RepID=T1K2Q1_TETUR
MANSENYSVSIASQYVCDLGEGPFYESTSDSIYYVDAFKGTIIRSPLNNEPKDIHALGFRLVSLIIPYANDSQTFLITLDEKVAKYNWATRNVQILSSLPPHVDGKERFNDGKCDSRGRLIVGSVVESNQFQGIVKGKGSIYRLEGNQLKKLADGFTLSNGMDWSVDGELFYFNDSEDQKIYVFDYDQENGTLSNKRVFIDFKNHTEFKSNEYPDGLVVDANNFIWTALYGGGRLVKINSRTAKVELSINVPASKVTSLTFGEPQLNKIYVTSSHSETEPDSGKLYLIHSINSEIKGKGLAQKFVS